MEKCGENAGVAVVGAPNSKKNLAQSKCFLRYRDNAGPSRLTFMLVNRA